MQVHKHRHIYVRIYIHWGKNVCTHTVIHLHVQVHTHVNTCAHTHTQTSLKGKRNWKLLVLEEHESELCSSRGHW